jgi:autotransporter-associated beta strand protein
VPTAGDELVAQGNIFDGPPAGQNRNPRYAGRTNNGCQGANCNPPDTASVAAADDPIWFPSGNPLTTNPFFADCAGADLLRSYITLGADYVYDGDTNSLSTPGSFNNNDRVINVINGDANLAATDLRPSPGDTGAGVLLVTGNLTMAGNSNYHGVIIVLGGTIEIGGGGGGTITGGVFVTNTTTCPATATLGTATFFPNGGAITIQYDSTWANPANGWLPMQILSMN